ncbi:MAG: hypothetical protein JWR37_655 [Mycobacterium sp.]|nr:hypothetical protein [Mycobacterium sp.]
MVVPISQAAAGWLIFLAAMLFFLSGFAVRSFVGRRRRTKTMRRIVHLYRSTPLARFLFGPVQDDVPTDEELDNVILLPAIVVACGLSLVAIFVLGSDAIGTRFAIFRR